jgi:hypothetical protein
MKNGRLPVFGAFCAVDWRNLAKGIPSLEWRSVQELGRVSNLSLMPSYSGSALVRKFGIRDSIDLMNVRLAKCTPVLVLFFISSIAFSDSSLFADTILLKSGEKTEGRILRESQLSVTISTGTSSTDKRSINWMVLNGKN